MHHRNPHSIDGFVAMLCLELVARPGDLARFLEGN